MNKLKNKEQLNSLCFAFLPKATISFAGRSSGLFCFSSFPSCKRRTVVEIAKTYAVHLALHNELTATGTAPD
jgi:hypothetical protein